MFPTHPTIRDRQIRTRLALVGPSNAAASKGHDAPDCGNRRPTTAVLPTESLGPYPRRILGPGLSLAGATHPDDDFDLETLEGEACIRAIGGTGTYGLGGMF